MLYKEKNKAKFVACLAFLLNYAYASESVQENSSQQEQGNKQIRGGEDQKYKLFMDNFDPERKKIKADNFSDLYFAREKFVMGIVKDAGTVASKINDLKYQGLNKNIIRTIVLYPPLGFNINFAESLNKYFKNLNNALELEKSARRRVDRTKEIINNIDENINHSHMSNDYYVNSDSARDTSYSNLDSYRRLLEKQSLEYRHASAAAVFLENLNVVSAYLSGYEIDVTDPKAGKLLITLNDKISEREIKSIYALIDFIQHSIEILANNKVDLEKLFGNDFSSKLEEYKQIKIPEQYMPINKS